MDAAPKGGRTTAGQDGQDGQDWQDEGSGMPRREHPDGGHILERSFNSRTIVPTLSVQFQRSFSAVNP
jgi:hypothetical protein